MASYIWLINRPGRAEWATSMVVARLVALHYVETMRENKATGRVSVDAIPAPPHNPSFTQLVDWLNGNHDAVERRMEWEFYGGSVIKRKRGKRMLKPAEVAWNVNSHPSISYAAWIDTVQRDLGLRELIMRAPDPRSLFIAMKLAGYTYARHYKLRISIVRYLYHWCHGVLVDTDKDVE